MMMMMVTRVLDLLPGSCGFYLIIIIIITLIIVYNTIIQ